ncbi:MAG TPA: type II secretion system protein [Actinomycetota bacterium]|jgi:type II secretory pathway pseudopilin PulG
MAAFGKTRGEDGFTLVETVASIAVFTILTVGVIPLLATSLKGVDLARTLTRGKNLAQEYMERVRGLPYFDAAPRRDVLDLYFPNLSTGYNAATKTFTTTCTETTSTPAASGALACPPKNPDGTTRIPPGHTVTYTAQFVRPVLNSNPETYNVVTPYVGYDSASGGSAVPPANLLRITVNVAWTQAGKARQFQLVSLLGDRKLGVDQLHGESSVDFVVQALTSYQDSSGRLSSLTAVAGQSKSDIEVKAFAGADTDVTAGRINLSRQEFGASPGATIASVAGAQSNQHAPPSTSPMMSSGVAQTVSNTDLFPVLPVAGLAATNVNESVPAPTVHVTGELPKAVTNFNYPSSTELFWVNNQADTGRNTLLHLHATEHPFSIQRVSSNRLSGNTYAEATAVSPVASRKVQATAHAQFGKAIVLPTTFASGDRGVVVISNFVADVDCKSTGSLAGAVATGAWSATLTYWRDSDPSDGAANGGFATVPISGSTTGTGTDPLAAIEAENPLVYDSVLSSGDVYLFDRPAQGKVGYLDTWSTKTTMTSAKTSQDASVSMPYAINIVTAKTNQSNEESKLIINIGKLTCQTADRRA